jgi:molybdenum cofactor biosynthesis enzyme
MLTEIEVTIDVTVSVLIAEYVETDVTVSVVVDTPVEMESTTAVEVAVNGNTHEVMVEGAASSCCGDLDPS